MVYFSYAAFFPLIVHKVIEYLIVDDVLDLIQYLFKSLSFNILGQEPHIIDLGVSRTYSMKCHLIYFVLIIKEAFILKTYL